MASIINAATSGGLVTTADTSGILQLQTAGTTALTVNASQIATFANAPVMSLASATGTLPIASLPSGSVIQVANLASQTVFSTTETTMQQGPQTSTFTLLSNSSKVMVIANFALYGYSAAVSGVYIFCSLYRGSVASGTRLSSTLLIDGKGSLQTSYTGVAGEMYNITALTYLDTPTASTTYSIGYAKHPSANNAYIQGCNITLMEISV